MSDVHPTAVVHERAQIGAGTTIGPYTVIGPNVSVGRENQIGSHAVIAGHTTLGDGNQVFQFASVGSVPQDLKYHGEPSTLEIGDQNIIREYVTINPGTEGGGMQTKIGSRNLFMVSSHVGHDSVIGDSNVIANGVAIAGHVVIDNFATLGGLSAIHQFVHIGDHAFLGGGAMVANDIPPFCMAQGDRAKLVGLNSVGLTRHEFSADDVELLKRVYRTLFVSSGLSSERLQRAGEIAGEHPAALRLLEFVRSSERGVAKARMSQRGLEDGESNSDAD